MKVLWVSMVRLKTHTQLIMVNQPTRPKKTPLPPHRNKALDWGAFNGTRLVSLDFRFGVCTKSRGRWRLICRFGPSHPEVLTSMRQLSNLVLMHRSTHGKSMDGGCWMLEMGSPHTGAIFSFVSPDFSMALKIRCIFSYQMLRV